jgi:hypothetical protein
VVEIVVVAAEAAAADVVAVAEDVTNTTESLP